MSYTTLSSSTVYRSRVLAVEEQLVRLPGGTEKTHVTVRHPGAVVIVPQKTDGKFLFTRQYRHSISREMLELPAGTLEPGEEPQQCAAREIQEEVGVSAASWTPLGVLYPAPGFCDELQHCFLARDLNPSVLPADEDEIIEAVELSAKEVLDAIAAGQITDSKTLACLYLLQLKQR